MYKKRLGGISGSTYGLTRSGSGHVDRGGVGAARRRGTTVAGEASGEVAGVGAGRIWRRSAAGAASRVRGAPGRAALREAALDLGANERQVLMQITIPLIAPAILSGTLLAFAMSLDDVVISSFLTGAELNTLPIKVYSQVKVGVKPEVNALCTVILLVTFLIVVAAGGLARYKGKRRVSL